MLKTTLDILFDNTHYPCLERENVAKIMDDCGLVLVQSEDGKYLFDYYNIEGNEQSKGIYIFSDK